MCLQGIFEGRTCVLPGTQRLLETFSAHERLSDHLTQMTVDKCREVIYLIMSSNICEIITHYNTNISLILLFIMVINFILLCIIDKTIGKIQDPY